MSISTRKPYFGVDRRPIAIFHPNSLGCSATGISSLGWHEKYEYEDGLEEFIREFLTNGARRGSRRFICMYPAGAAPDVGSANIYQPFFSSTLKINYSGQSCTRDNPFLVWSNPVNIWRDKISEWKNEFGLSCEFGVGMSFLTPSGGYSDYSSIGASGNLMTQSQGNAQVLSWINYNASNWKSIGADSIAFSHIDQMIYYAPKTSPSVQHYLQSNLGMRCMGIGLPDDKSESKKRLGDIAYSTSPYLLRVNGVEGSATNAIAGSWDPELTEIHVSIPASKINEYIISSYFQRGIIIGIEFEPEIPESFYQAVEMVNEVYGGLERRRLLNSSRKLTVFSMAAGDSKDAYGQPDSKFYAFNSSKANMNKNIIPTIRVNCSSYEYPRDPERFFIPSWWWSNSKSQCPDPSMMESVNNSWMDVPFDRRIVLASTTSPYGTTGPEKCADACFDMMIQYISKYGSLKDRPWSSSFDAVVSFENWGGSRFCSDGPSLGISVGECRLFGHTSDALSGSAGDVPLYDLSSPYISNGIEECKEWLDRFALRFVSRRNGYAKSTIGYVPPAPSKFIFNNISLPKYSHFMIDAAKKDDASRMIGKNIKRNIDLFYGSISSILKDSRFSSFSFGEDTLQSFYENALSSKEFDVDASLPDSAGTIGSYGLTDARHDKDGIMYQPNSPMRRWMAQAIVKIATYGIQKAFSDSLAKHFCGSNWMIPGITIDNNGKRNCYDLNSLICSDIMSYKETDTAAGGVSSPIEKRMHISRLVMPGLHSQKLPENINIICFDMCGSSVIKDGTFMPIWGASYNRPLVGISSAISENTPIGSIAVSSDRSTWHDIPGSFFSSKDAYSIVDVKSSKPAKYNSYSNPVSSLESTAAKANTESNLRIMEYLISQVSDSEKVFMPFILGTSISDSSWKEDSNIGSIRSGTPTSPKNSNKYRVDRQHLSDLLNAVVSRGCNSVVHIPEAHILGDWNNIADAVENVNRIDVNQSSISTQEEVAPVSVNQNFNSIEANASYALSIAYDYSFMKSVLQTTSRPKIEIDDDSLRQGILSISLFSSDSKSKYKLPVIELKELKVIDVSNILNKQEGIVSKVLNGNANVPALALSVERNGIDRSGWIFLSFSNNPKSSKISSEARSRPFDYLRLKNTSISPQISQSNSQFSFGGFATDSDTYNYATISSPVYVSSQMISIDEDISSKPFIASINGEIIKVDGVDGKRIRVASRGSYGTRRKMHLPGDQIVYSENEIFDNRFGSENNKYEQYRCFALKNIGSKVTIHDIAFFGTSNSSSAKVEIAIEVPSINAQFMQVKSSGKNTIQLTELSKFNKKEKETLLGTLMGVQLPNGVYSYKTVESVNEDSITLSSPFPFSPATGSRVLVLGSKSGYSGGGLFYPTSVGNGMSDFYRVMSGDSVYLNQMKITPYISLSENQYVYMWLRRKILPGSKSIDGGNFMPRIEFEVS